MVPVRARLAINTYQGLTCEPIINVRTPDNVIDIIIQVIGIYSPEIIVNKQIMTDNKRNVCLYQRR